MLVLTALVGCQKNITSQVQAEFDDYHDRLATVLKIPHTTDTLLQTTPIVAVILPRKRERTLAIPKNTLALYDFLRLENCALKKLVAKKNNQLGQHMQAINGIQYEIAVRQEITNCLPKQEKAELKILLQQAQLIKKESKLADFWQYSFGASWYGQFTSKSTDVLAWRNDERLLASKQALQQLNQTLTPVLMQKNVELARSSNTVNLDLSIQTLENGQAYGVWLNSINMSISSLQKTNHLLAKASKNTVCYTNAQGKSEPNQQLKYFNTVVVKYFAQNIQTYLAQVSQEGRALLAEQHKLLTAFVKLTDNNTATTIPLQKMLQFHDSSNQLMSQFEQTIKAHVLEVQRIQKLCNY